MCYNSTFGTMADQFLAEQHAWTLRQAQAQAEETESDSSDEADSWVMLSQDGNIVPLQNERILHTSRPRVGLDISAPRELRNAEPFSVRSDSGTAYITNRRVSRSLPALTLRALRSVIWLG